MEEKVKVELSVEEIKSILEDMHQVAFEFGLEEESSKIMDKLINKLKELGVDYEMNWC